MPKKACCCDPKGRHVAVACRYYGGHALLYVRDSVPPSAGFSGFTGDIRFIGPDGFKTGTTGFQRVFGYTQGPPEFGNPTGVRVRGPYKWELNIERFDSTRDVIFLMRSGGGSSQFEYTSDQSAPKGGHSSLLQTRIKASLSTEGFVGAGGTLFRGGQGSGIGSLLSPSYNPNSVAGAGAGGGDRGRGGHGGITVGIAGLASGGGQPGTQTAGGSAGGPGAFPGTQFVGGSGGILSGWGGGGRYAGGGGDNKAGGGGGASKWPTSLSGYNDISFSAPGSDKGPGNICDPFTPYYTIVENQSATVPAGMGGGANLVTDVDPAFPQPETTFIGFGNDFNPKKDGVPGIIKAVWIDRFCPCDPSKTDLPDKMYICLTDIQYQTIQNYFDSNPENDFVKFDIEGETYIYFGICTNAYCDNVRLVEGDVSNIKPVTNNIASIGKPNGGQMMNDCCKVIISWPVCKILSANCFDCNNCNSCAVNQKLKYCCENIDELPDSYWSIYQGWLWQSAKTDFWFPFGKSPEDTPFIITQDIRAQLGNLALIVDIYGSNGFEKICLPVFGEGQAPGDLCIENANEGCEDLSCVVETGTLWNFPHPLYLPYSINVSAVVCGKKQRTSVLATIDGINCDCIETGTDCLNATPCLEQNEVSIKYNSFCNPTPINSSGSFGDCQSPFGGFPPNASAQVYIEDLTALYSSFIKPVLGITITIPNCPGTNFPPSFATLQGMCGRGISVLPNFGLNLGTIASVLNQNPYGISYVANQPDIYIDARYGAELCPEYSGSDIPAAADLFDTFTTDTSDPTKVIKKYYYKPRIYLYKIQLNANGVGGSSTTTCSGAPCECLAPFYSSYAETFSSQSCVWGYYNLVTMNQPIFAPGNSNSDGTCSIPSGILSAIMNDFIDLPYGGWPEPLASSTEKAICTEYANACLAEIVSERVSCTGKITCTIG